jgi:transposase
MESTGVYWIPLYDILEERGLKPCLVNARHMKNVPGRRTHTKARALRGQIRISLTIRAWKTEVSFSFRPFWSNASFS